MSDSQAQELSKKSWDLLFNPNYEMAAYNVSSDLLSVFSGEGDLSNLDVGSGGGFGGNSEDPLADVQPLTDNTTRIIKHPIVFTDSFVLPVDYKYDTYELLIKRVTKLPSIHTERVLIHKEAELSVGRRIRLWIRDSDFSSVGLGIFRGTGQIK
jgi:hypothetical protein